MYRLSQMLVCNCYNWQARTLLYSAWTLPLLDGRLVGNQNKSLLSALWGGNEDRSWKHNMKIVKSVYSVSSKLSTAYIYFIFDGEYIRSLC